MKYADAVATRVFKRLQQLAPTQPAIEPVNARDEDFLRRARRVNAELRHDCESPTAHVISHGLLDDLLNLDNVTERSIYAAIAGFEMVLAAHNVNIEESIRESRSVW